MSRGMVMPASTSIAVACRATSVIAWASSGSDHCRPVPSVRPTMIGVPTAPKVTAETSATRARHTAARAGKPSAISSGAATVAGVPNPAAPSMKQTRNHPTKSIWIRLSGLTLSTSSRISARAPEARMTPRKARAPRTMRTTEAAMISPSITDAEICTAGTPHASIARAIVMTRARGIALAAGMRRRTSSTATERTGMSAANHCPTFIRILSTTRDQASGVGTAGAPPSWWASRMAVAAGVLPDRAAKCRCGFRVSGAIASLRRVCHGICGIHVRLGLVGMPGVADVGGASDDSAHGSASPDAGAGRRRVRAPDRGRAAAGGCCGSRIHRSARRAGHHELAVADRPGPRPPRSWRFATRSTRVGRSEAGRATASSATPATGSRRAATTRWGPRTAHRSARSEPSTPSTSRRQGSTSPRSSVL